jgi:hypothetical protein
MLLIAHTPASDDQLHRDMAAGQKQRKRHQMHQATQLTTAPASLCVTSLFQTWQIDSAPDEKIPLGAGWIDRLALCCEPTLHRRDYRPHADLSSGFNCLDPCLFLPSFDMRQCVGESCAQSCALSVLVLLQCHETMCRVLPRLTRRSWSLDPRLETYY